VVQQGLNDATGLARRYIWHSATVRDFTSEPHTAIVGGNEGVIMNLVDAQAKPAQHAMLEMVRQEPGSLLEEFRRLVMPRHHDVPAQDVDTNRLAAVLAMAYQRELRDFASVLLLENLGPRTLQSLALIAEVIHGAPSRFTDPARFSFAHGGKDGHPFPVPLNTYDESIGVLRRGLESAKLNDPDRTDGLRRLDRFVNAIEKRHRPDVELSTVLAHERAISSSLGGRTVGDNRKGKKGETRQLSLF